ncbi:MAG: hypothetical protein HW386_1759 [Gammaproteobacteria bacterium]|nr:hypothetical protein [Gammaproteobacteria bacterium]
MFIIHVKVYKVLNYMKIRMSMAGVRYLNAGPGPGCTILII